MINDGRVVICRVLIINQMVIEMDIIIDTCWLLDDYKGSNPTQCMVDFHCPSPENPVLNHNGMTFRVWSAVELKVLMHIHEHPAHE